MKYFIYKGTGGLFHNLRGLCYSINMALKHNIILIIDMDIHKAFGGNFDEYFVIKCDKLKYSTTYKNLNEELIGKYKNKRAGAFGYFNNKLKNSLGYKNSYNKINLSKSINILYGCGLGRETINTLEFIKVKNEYFNTLKLNNKPIKSKYISIHFRNTDRKNDCNKFINKIKIVSKENNIKTLYIASDDYKFYENIELQFPNLNIIRNTYPAKNIINLHYTNSDKKKHMYDCFVDIYYILLSNIFIPSVNSGFSRAIMNMINNNYTFFPGIISKSIIIK